MNGITINETHYTENDLMEISIEHQLNSRPEAINYLKIRAYNKLVYEHNHRGN